MFEGGLNVIMIMKGPYTDSGIKLKINSSN